MILIQYDDIEIYVKFLQFKSNSLFKYKNRNSIRKQAHMYNFGESFQLTNYKNNNNKNIQFLNDQKKFGFNSNLPSPIAKMNFDNQSTISKQDLFNYSSNTTIKQQSPYIHKSYAQSPQKQNKFQKKENYFLRNKKFSIPDIGIFNDQSWKNQLNIKNNLSKQSQQDIPFRKNNAKRNQLTLQNQEDCQTFNRKNQFHSQKLIQHNKYEGNQNQMNNLQYKNLASNYDLLQRQYQKIKQENLRLKNNKQELMNDNVKIKKDAQNHIFQLSNQIENLKQKIYRIQMQKPQQQSTRFINSRINTNRQGISIGSARSSFSQTPQQAYNPFYIAQIQRQNQLLIRQNKRLNQIVVKRLKHSVMDC